MDNPFAISSASVQRRFDKASATFDSADFVHAATRDGLFTRLAPMLVDAKTVVDLGCATGKSIKPLANHFRGAKIIGVDASAGMLERCRARRYWFAKTSFVQADAQALPFPDGSVDVVFSNLMLHWVDDLPAVAREVARVLRKDGLFLFATLGPDTFAALRNAWARVDSYPHVHGFADMHDVGDCLSRSGLRDPVLDVDHLTVTYRDIDKLLQELSAAGARNALRHRYPGLMTPSRLASFRNNLAKEADDGDIAVGFEIVYGHCWGSGARSADGNVRIDAGAIPVRRR
ncbi:MAG: methyltransferase domain-containing protein [Woeseiaceae bacterium]|nr:methyltransferase domain-containing protein [Woeseiaceae bacterium]